MAQELLEDFHQNRDYHYRTQLIALQNDMNLIQQADPYSTEPLEDSPEDIARQIEATSAGNPFAAEMSTMAGRWYSEFVYEINEAKDAKDLGLINLAVCSSPTSCHLRRIADSVYTEGSPEQTRATQVRMRL